ncbi:hypothetical protein DLAC_11747 [Tieghemostelium lacteum]|uniref:Beta-lactamase-related domain-containing protein n=1 Tax=Tieghemostelium lacteum TaxID=361077 RepID=A0A151Z8G5_TIELA|nr:hypothetical protein DLAC_11747 [Tieghemostelium lacteum]|eukprot:KYQ90263.1 hypothetical protein DLAC_11747 [Tieghemostelium lacteum]
MLLSKGLTLLGFGVGLGVGIGYSTTSKISLERNLDKTLETNNVVKSDDTSRIETLNNNRNRNVIKTLNREIISWKEANCIPGISVCVMVGGKVVFNKGYGYSDIENAIPMSADTKFRIASISKTLTSSGVGVLLDQGKLSLDDSIYKHVPEFPRHPKYPDMDITIRQIASHLGGIRHYKKGKESEHFSTVQYKSSKVKSLEKYPTPLDIFISDPWHEHQPGLKYNYSTFSFTLLGTVLENVTGMDYASFMKSNIFDPIGMKNTVVDEHDTVIPGRTRQYNLVGNSNSTVPFQLKNCELANVSYKHAGGGFLSTSRDICKFGSAIMSGAILQPSTVAQLFTEQTNSSGELVKYGIGWQLKKRFVYHTGNAVGGSTVLVMIPDQSIVVCVLTNQQNTRQIDEFGFKLASIFDKTQ